MKMRRSSVLGSVAALGLISVARGQATLPPTPPAGSAAPLALPASTAAATPATAAQPTLWGFLGISKAGCAACKDKICNSQLGVLLNGASAPVSGLTGGIIPPFCPPVPSASELAAIEAMPAGERGPAEVAAMIKADEAAAKARVAAIEYLGTVDCRYWPEATEQLVNALRADRNECVRFAAARVLSTGCCCNKETIDKLKISITGSEEDGKPAELSQRVRMAAQIALHNCLARYSEPFEAPPPPERETEEPTPTDSPDEKREEATPAIPLSVGTTDGHPGGDGLVQTAYERQIARKPAAQVVAEARQALLMASQQRASAMTTGRRSVYHAFSKAVTAPGDRGTPGAMAPRLPLSHTTAAQTAGGGDRSHDPAVVNTSTAARSSGAAAASGNRGLLGIFSDSRRRGSR